MLKKCLAAFIIAALFATVAGLFVPTQTAEAGIRKITHTTVHWKKLVAMVLFVPVEVTSL